MDARSAARKIISDEVLNLSVRIRLEAGVDHAVIRQLVERFAADAAPGEQTGDIIGFLTVENIPADRRQEFLQAVAELPTSGGRVDVRRLLSAADIWPSRVT